MVNHLNVGLDAYEWYWLKLESHVIEFQYLGIIKVLNNRKREKERERVAGVMS